MLKITIILLIISSILLTTLNAKEATLEQKISGLYIAFFNRAADKSGMDFWLTKADIEVENGGTASDALKELSEGFVENKVFTSTYAGMTNKEFVEAIYKNTLGRPGDAEGIAYWTALLDSGTTKSDMVSDFIELSLESDLTTTNFPNLTQTDLDAAILRQDLLTNKADVAVHFTNTLKTATNIINPNDLENDAAYMASIEILSGVTIDRATFTTATARINGIKNDTDAISQINSGWNTIPEYENATDITIDKMDINFSILHSSATSSRAIKRSKISRPTANPNDYFAPTKLECESKGAIYDASGACLATSLQATQICESSNATVPTSEEYTLFFSTCNYLTTGTYSENVASNMNDASVLSCAIDFGFISARANWYSYDSINYVLDLASGDAYTYYTDTQASLQCRKTAVVAITEPEVTVLEAEIVDIRTSESIFITDIIFFNGKSFAFGNNGDYSISTEADGDTIETFFDNNIAYKSIISGYEIYYRYYGDYKKYLISSIYDNGVEVYNVEENMIVDNTVVETTYDISTILVNGTSSTSSSTSTLTLDGTSTGSTASVSNLSSSPIYKAPSINTLDTMLNELEAYFKSPVLLINNAILHTIGIPESIKNAITQAIDDSSNYDGSGLRISSHLEISETFVDYSGTTLAEYLWLNLKDASNEGQLLVETVQILDKDNIGRYSNEILNYLRNKYNSDPLITYNNLVQSELSSYIDDSCSSGDTDVELCTLPNATAFRSKICLDSDIWSLRGTCKVSTCDTGYRKENGVCVKNCTRDLTAECSTSASNAYAQTTQTCEADGILSYPSSCEVSSCRCGYSLDNGTCIKNNSTCLTSNITVINSGGNTSGTITSTTGSTTSVGGTSTSTSRRIVVSSTESDFTPSYTKSQSISNGEILAMEKAENKCKYTYNGTPFEGSDLNTYQTEYCNESTLFGETLYLCFVKATIYCNY